MSSRWLVSVCVGLSSLGMVSSSFSSPFALSARGDAESAVKRRALERDLELAHHRVEIAELSLDAEKESTASDIEFAEREVDLARAERARFEKYDRSGRIAGMEAELKRLEDSATEAAEELAQIELMYKDQDLDDKTAEFVVSRGRRNAERRELDLKLRRRAFDGLMDELENLSARKGMDVDRSVAALSKAVRAARISILSKQVGLMEARSKRDSVRDEMEALDRKEAERATQEGETESGGAKQGLESGT